jgi:DNA end-binding protein Ku
MAEDNGKKAYALLYKALVDTETVGIGKLMMHQRDYTVFLRPYQHGLVLHTMYFANEIRELPEYGVLENVALKPQEVKLTEQLVESMTEHFKPKQYHNEFQERLKKLIEAKLHGKSVAIADEGPRRAPVIDMMSALKKSLAATSSTSPASTSKKKESKRTRKAAHGMRKAG